MSDSLPEVPDLDPSTLAGASFGRSRKGFEPTEVRSMLGRASDAMRVWAQRDAQLVARVEELSRRLDEAEVFDEDRVTELLGVETARIITAARSAANEMRAEAERESAALLEASRTDAEATAERLLGQASKDREAAATARADAESTAAEIIANANATSETLMSEATAAAEQLTTSSEKAATALRESAQEESDRLRSEGQRRHDELIESASSVMAERTAEAEAAANDIRTNAETELETARSEASELIDAATAEAERLRADARAEAAAGLDLAREEGRQMVAEAREVRHRMLRDAAERSRGGRQKLEAAQAARLAAIDAIRTAANALGGSLADLDDSETLIRRAAEDAAAAVTDDVEIVARELEESLAGPSTVEVAPHEQATVEADQDAVGSADAETDAEATEVEGSEDGGSSDAAAEESGEVVAEGEAPGAQDGPTESPESPDSPGVPVAVGADDQMASVHDLFERLRSTEESEGPDDSGRGGGAEDGDGDAVDSSIDLTEEGHPAAASGPAVAPVPPPAPVTDTSSPSSAAGGAEMATSGAAALAVATEEVPEGDGSVLDRRDELLAPAERLLARNLKRLVSDEQNEVLDRARRIKRGRPELEELLGPDATDTYTATLADPYLLAAAAGSRLWSELSAVEAPEPVAADVADALAKQVAELLELRRVRVREALEHHDESGADTSELVDQMRAVYRDLRTNSVPELAADLAAGGFTCGSRCAAGPASHWRWVVDNGGLPCADAEDNALAGATRCGEEFPTGDVAPPAHPGCRCIVVPAEA